MGYGVKTYSRYFESKQNSIYSRSAGRQILFRSAASKYINKPQNTSNERLTCRFLYESLNA